MGEKRNHSLLLLAAGLVAGLFVLSCTKEPSLLNQPTNEPQIKAFFDAKEAQARQLVSQENRELPPEIWPYFEAGKKGDWNAAAKLYWAMANRCYQFPSNATYDKRMETMAWHPINETFRFYLQCTQADSKYALKYGEEILQHVPPGSIYFGDNDAGRFVVTALCRDHSKGDPFYVITQNALGDAIYRNYLDSTFGKHISVPTHDDFVKAFDEFAADVYARSKQGKLKWDEKVTKDGASIALEGIASIVGINSLISRTMFHRNHDREFYLIMAYPPDWMFPHLEPHGPVLKICRTQHEHLSAEIIARDRAYWDEMIKPLIGDWLHETSTVLQLCEFIERTHVQKMPAANQGDRAFTQTALHSLKDPQYFTAGMAWSHARSAISRVYYWHLARGKTSEEQQLLLRELDLSLRQSIALYPCSNESVHMYVQLLITLSKKNEARQLLKTLQKLEPNKFSAMEKELLK
ncbi:MAG: hypothetical protein ACO1QS_08270 [Verrucomicrobiota bacterium]